MKIADVWPLPAGRLEGKSVLQDPHSGQPEASASAVTVSPLLDGRFLRLDYTWAYQGKPQEGSLLLGYVKKEETVSGHWIDSWHMGSQVMELSGKKPQGATVSLRGSYAAPPGPDWGWRIDLTREGNEVRLVMWNIWPEGKEDLAVEATYSAA